MGNEVMVLTKKELEKNPQAIGESILELALAIEDTKSTRIHASIINFYLKSFY